MVCCLHNNYICAEVGSQHEIQRTNYVWLFWFTSRETQLRELFIGTQHHQVRTKHHSSRRNMQSLLWHVLKQHVTKGTISETRHAAHCRQDTMCLQYSKLLESNSKSETIINYSNSFTVIRRKHPILTIATTTLTRKHSVY